MSRLPRNPSRSYDKTRKQRISRLRRDLVHAAGEVNLNHNCVITLCFRTDIDLTDFDNDEGKETLEFIRTGAVIVPRSLRNIWRKLLIS
jgi:hypothetical protein